jgi:hypothetical protein
MNMALDSQSNVPIDLSNQNQEKSIPSWIVWTQCICFAILYSIWNYPLTNFLSDLCMVIGASLSVYVLFLNRSFFRTSKALPFWLLMTLFAWLVFHLLFLSNNFPLQLRELTNIWKRAFIAIIFALGFGMALTKGQSKKGQWIIFYAGMVMPALIYLAKYFLNLNAAKYGLVIPDYLRLYQGRESIFYIYKTDYVSFCLPALAITLAQLKNNLQKGFVFTGANLIYVLVVVAVLATFYLDNIKNGFAYSAILLIAFVLLVLNSEFNKLATTSFHIGNLRRFLLKLILVFVLGFLSLPIITRHIEQNPSWKSLWADSKVAVQVDKLDQWKYWGAHGYPLNEYGNPVSPTNYERLSWGIIGLRLLQKNPQGYGLAEDSFGYLTKIQWPDSLLRQSHSGWLDLALGTGLPGVSLILGALGLVMLQFSRSFTENEDSSRQSIWASRLIWVFWALILLWCTSEISLKIHIIALLFWISLGAGVSANLKAKEGPLMKS